MLPGGLGRGRSRGRRAGRGAAGLPAGLHVRVDVGGVVLKLFGLLQVAVTIPYHKKTPRKKEIQKRHYRMHLEVSNRYGHAELQIVQKGFTKVA